MKPHICICMIQERCNDGCIIPTDKNPGYYKYIAKCKYPEGACICKITKKEITRHQDYWKRCLEEVEKDMITTKFSKDSLRRDTNYFVEQFEEIYTELKTAERRLNLYYPEK